MKVLQLTYFHQIWCGTNTAMKMQKSEPISAFGGINFVFEFLEQNNINKLIETSFPRLANQSQYRWTDIINSLLSIYLCGGDCIEDLQTHLKHHFVKTHL